MKKLIYLFTLIFFSFALRAESPRGGSIIENQAEAFYFNVAKNESETKYSNKVIVTIAQIFDLELTPKNIKLSKYKGDKVFLIHDIKNKGNTIVNVNIEFNHIIEDNDFNMSDVEYYIDVNKNQTIDEQDFRLLPNDINTSGFNIDEVKTIIISANIPNFVNFGDISNVEIKASIPLEVEEKSLDEIEILAEPELIISGNANKSESNVKENVVFFFNSNNISDVNALPKFVNVDSATLNYVVVESKIPTNTKFQSYESGDEEIFAYHIIGTPEDNYTTQQPSDLSIIDRVVFLYSEIDKNSSEIGSYSVLINENASEFIETDFSVSYTKNNVDEEIRVSNNIRVELPEIEASLDNYRDGFIGITNIIRIGNGLNIRADVSKCNTDASEIESYPITIQAEGSGDADSTFFVVETGFNTGIFEVTDIPTVLTPEVPVSFDNSRMEVVRKDNLLVELDCNDVNLSSNVLVDPLGIVFNSLTNEPVPNVTVELVGIDSLGNEFVPEVFDLELNPISNIQNTDNDGLYWFPLINPGNYKLRVTNLTSHKFPSKLSVDKIDSTRQIDLNGSYEKIFNVPEGSPIITIDIPIDPILNNNLLIKKEADKVNAEIGDVIEYNVTLTNLSSQNIDDVVVIDTLPIGFELLDVKEFEFEKENNTFRINIPLMLAGEEIEISYKTLVKMNARNGDGVNTVRAFGELYESNIAKSRVNIQNDAIFDNPLIMGKIYKDCNANNEKDEDEIGIAGVRVYLDNGYYAITDKNGNYKIYNLRAKTYAVRVDKSTLPKPYKFEVTSNKNARDPFSQFSDLKYGELARADFRDLNCSEKSIEISKNRINNLDNVKSEVERSANRELNFNQRVKNDLKSELDEGLIEEKIENINSIYSNDILNTDEQEIEGETSSNIIIDEVEDESYIENIYIDELIEEETIDLIKRNNEPKDVLTTIDLEKQAKKIGFDNSIGFVDIFDNDILKQNQVSLRLKGRSSTQIQLIVNNKLIDVGKIGQSVVFSDKNLQMVEYISVQLASGVNILEVREIDGFGNLRGEKAIKVLASGKLEKISVDLPENNKIVANPKESVEVIVNLLDKNDIPVSGKYTITLDNTIGFWDVEDLNDIERGIQTVIEDGQGKFELIPPDSANSGILEFKVNDIYKKEKLLATTYLRDLFAVGVVEGVFNFDNNKLGENVVTTGLEEEFSNIEIGQSENARVSLFLKGKIKGDFLLTLAYDSDKKERDKLFEDIEPEEFYPIYGDSSINGFEAQSTSKLFIKIEKGNSFLLYGDINTQDYSNQNINLGNYNRSLTGARHSLEDNKYRFSYYIAQENFNARVKELRGEGSFGPYFFTDGENVVENSEKIKIITRDRITGTIINEVPLARFRDYEVNGFYDGIIFREAIPSLDKDLNQIFIRIEYEVESGNKEYLVYGASGEYNINNNLSVGIDFNKSEQEDAEYDIKSANVNYESSGFEANLEIAQSNNMGEKGLAANLYTKYNKDGNLIEVRSQIADDKFSNEYSSVRKANQETSIRARNRIAKGLNVKNSIFLTKDNNSNRKNRSLKSTVEKTIDDNFKIESGLRYTKTESDSFEKESTMGSARLTWKPSFYDSINTYYEYEQDFQFSEIKRQEFGIEHSLNDKGNVYLRHESLSNLNSQIEISEDITKNRQTVLGVDYGLSENTDIYTEYRIDEIINSRDSEAVVGARNRFKINDEWRGNVALERIESIEGERSSSTSLSTAFQQTINKDYKKIYRFQYRDSEAGDFYIGSLGYIRKINDDYSMLVKNTTSYEDENSAIKNRFFSGLAYRDNKHNKLNLLFKYENEIEKSESTIIENEFAVQANYRLNPKNEFSGMYSVKHINNNVDNFSYVGNWLSGRYSYFINDDLNLGLNMAYLFDNETAKNYIFGTELGFLVNDNLWLNFGYNFEGLEDNKFSQESFTSEGIYVRFRFKLSEENFEWLQ